MSATGMVRVRGARTHNLRNIDVDVPRDALVVFTGISGSGKSSLAFGTIYAEAQRRYFESVSPYARRLIDQVAVPEVDSIEGLPPAVALQQHGGAGGSRSSVGSVTTLSNLLRMLYSRAGAYPAGQHLLHAEDFSPNTPQGACARCHGLGRIYDVAETAMVPDPSLSIGERAIAAWPPAWHGQNLRDILVTLGHDIDTPWRKLPKKSREWILFTDEQPTVPVYAGFTAAEVRQALRRKMAPSYMGTFTGVRKYVLQTFRTSKSSMMKKRAARFLSAAICPICHGKRLKASALAVTYAGLDISSVAHFSLNELSSLLRDSLAPLRIKGWSADRQLVATRIIGNAGRPGTAEGYRQLAVRHRTRPRGDATGTMAGGSRTRRRFPRRPDHLQWPPRGAARSGRLGNPTVSVRSSATSDPYAAHSTGMAAADRRHTQ